MIDYFRPALGAVLVVGLAALPCAAIAKSKKNPLRETFIAQANDSYRVKPDIAKCKTGALKESEKQEVLTIINEIRALHGLAPVVYDTEGDTQVMEASLMFAANARLSHNPPETWKCYTKDGAYAAGASNIYGGLASPNLTYYTPKAFITGWLTDISNTIKDNIGHRRWLLDPFLQKIAYGSVQGPIDKTTQSGGAALKIIYRDRTGPAAAARAFVAYPDGDYPSDYFVNGALLSFSVVAGLDSKYPNTQVDFSEAVITVTERGGDIVPVSKIAWDTIGFGLPNNLQFKPEDIKPATYYDVSIKKVKVQGEMKDYSYWFRIVG